MDETDCICLPEADLKRRLNAAFWRGAITVWLCMAFFWGGSLILSILMME